MTVTTSLGIDDEEPPKVPDSPLQELGITGLRRSGGYLDEEFLPNLRGRKAVQVFREMSENDPTVAALVFAFDRLLRQVEWRVEPADSTPDSREAAEFVEQCMEDMSHTWDEFLSEALTCVVFGWSWHEIVYKRRVGPWEDDPRKRSRFTDGKIGWRKLPIRAQETLHKWQFDETSGVRGMWQMAPPDFKERYLPIERSLLFRPVAVKGNPEGRSMLRGAYRPWYFKKRIEEYEAVGLERDLVGMPMASIPSEYLNPKPGSSEEKMLVAMKAMVRGLRRSEHEGIVFPNDIDPETKMKLFELTLLGGGGTRQFAAGDIIERYDTRILMSVLADFILVGHQGVGSYSMHTDKTGLFRASINTVSQGIADVMNRHAIPRLFKVNNWQVEKLPRFAPNNVDPPDLAQLASFVSAMTSAGMPFFPDPDLEKFVRSAAQLPKLDESELRMREQESVYDQIMRVSQARLGLMQTVQQSSAMIQGTGQAVDPQNPAGGGSPAGTPGGDPGTPQGPAQAGPNRPPAPAVPEQAPVEPPQPTQPVQKDLLPEQKQKVKEVVGISSLIADASSRPFRERTGAEKIRRLKKEKRP